MLGLLTSLLFTLAGTGAGYLMLRPWVSHLSPNIRFGLCTLAGLGGLGTALTFVGMLKGTIHVLPVLALILGAIGWGLGRGSLLPKFRLPRKFEWLAVLALVLVSLIPMLGVLVPSTTADWDTIAYHLAVPKIWLTDGAVHPVSFIHHSNFPGAVDGLFTIGLSVAGQAGAKGINFWIFVVGTLLIFGLARERVPSAGALFSAVMFAATPVVLWEAGTGYIDVAHGLYCGLGAWLMLVPGENRRDRILVGALLLGLGAGSKYTGIVSLGLAGTVLIATSQGLGALRWKTVGLAAGLAAAVCLPWYVRNELTVGNPVYPFFYSKLGGLNWDEKQSEIYTNEQKSFGVPNSATSLGSSILGLAYQPGRYINPGQKLQSLPDGSSVGGTGDRMGSIGFLGVAVALMAGVLGARRWGFGPLLAWLILHAVVWIGMSQQSRYALTFLPPLSLVGGLLFAQLPEKFGRPGLALSRGLMVALAAQLLMVRWVSQEGMLSPARIAVATGAISENDYLERMLPIYRASKLLGPSTKVALYDEVFGFYLNSKYMWASYGHTTEFGYLGMQTSADLLQAWKRLKITHVYVNLGPLVEDPKFVFETWTPSMGLAWNQDTREWQVAPLREMPAQQREALFQDVQTRWKPLLAELVAEGNLKLVGGQPSWVLFEIAEDK